LQAQHHEQAVEWLARAIRQEAKTDYLATLGTCLKLSGRRDEALKVFDKAVQLKPDDAGLWTHLAGMLAACEQNADALLAYQQALKLDPQHWDAAFHAATLLHRSERFEEALAPAKTRAAYDLAHLLLQTGDFEAGWAVREVRWDTPGFSAEYPRFSQNKWLGKEDVAGKTILVHIDEGLGDALQFARFVPMLAARGSFLSCRTGWSHC
jgi:tetratricopeptide (TPR) repeat protein